MTQRFRLGPRQNGSSFALTARHDATQWASIALSRAFPTRDFDFCSNLISVSLSTMNKRRHSPFVRVQYRAENKPACFATRSRLLRLPHNCSRQPKIQKKNCDSQCDPNQLPSAPISWPPFVADESRTRLISSMSLESFHSVQQQQQRQQA